MTIKALIFDLDGVIVDTAKYHFTAWRWLANELGTDFTKENNEKLKGVGRMESLDLILEWGGVTLSAEDKITWAAKKNEKYLEFVAKMDASEILPGIAEMIAEAKAKGLHIVLGSASRNAQNILKRTGLFNEFDAIIDGTKTTRSKPDPQVFQMGAEAVNIQPNEAIVFEDAEKGVAAALAGGFHVIGIGEETNLSDAHWVTNNLQGIDLQTIISKTNT